MPFRALTTLEDANIYGPTREIASGISYAGDIDLVFQSNGDLGERVFFEEWQKQVFNETTWNLNYHKEYVGEIQIFLLDMQDVRKYGVVLHEVYPKTINGVDLSAEGGGIIETSIGVSFRWWQALDETRTETDLRGETGLRRGTNSRRWLGLRVRIERLGDWNNPEERWGDRPRL